MTFGFPPSPPGRGVLVRGRLSDAAMRKVVYLSGCKLGTVLWGGSFLGDAEQSARNIETMKLLQWG